MISTYQYGSLLWLYKAVGFAGASGSWYHIREWHNLHRHDNCLIGVIAATLHATAHQDAVYWVDLVTGSPHHAQADVSTMTCGA